MSMSIFVTVMRHLSPVISKLIFNTFCSTFLNWCSVNIHGKSFSLFPCRKTLFIDLRLFDDKPPLTILLKNIPTIHCKQQDSGQDRFKLRIFIFSGQGINKNLEKGGRKVFLYFFLLKASTTMGILSARHTP